MARRTKPPAPDAGELSQGPVPDRLPAKPRRAKGGKKPKPGGKAPKSTTPILRVLAAKKRVSQPDHIAVQESPQPAEQEARIEAVPAAGPVQATEPDPPKALVQAPMAAIEWPKVTCPVAPARQDAQGPQPETPESNGSRLGQPGGSGG